MLTGNSSCGCGTEGLGCGMGCGELGDSESHPALTTSPKPPGRVLAVGAVALGLGIWAFLALVHAPRRKRSRYTGRVAEVVDGDETTRLPFESMSEVVFERRR